MTRLQTATNQIPQPATRQMHTIVYREWVQALEEECFGEIVSEVIRRENIRLYQRLFGSDTVRLADMSETEIRLVIGARQQYIDSVRGAQW